MKKYLTLIIFHLSLITFCDAQNPLVKQWDKRFGGIYEEWLYSFIQTIDSGYLLGGGSKSGVTGDKTQPKFGHEDFWVIKIDALGNKQWDKAFGGSESDNIRTLQQTADGGYIVGGSSQSGISGNKTQVGWGESDYWIVKIDSLGNKQWDKDFGGNEWDNLYSVQQTIDGGYILGGHSHSGVSGNKTEPNWNTSSAVADYWIIKIDSLGNKQWEKVFGGLADEYFTSMKQTTDGGYILGGFSRSGIGGDKTQPTWGVSDYWIVKIDSLGNKQWDKDFGSTDDDQLIELLQTADGGYLLGGSSESGFGGDKTQATWGQWDYWIIKTDFLGNKEWDKDFGGYYWDVLRSLKQTTDGYLFSGESSSNISGDKTENNLGYSQTWLIKTDTLGNKQWDKTILTTGADQAGRAIQTIDGCFAIASYCSGGIGGYKTQPNWDPTNSTHDYWIIKFCVAPPTVQLSASTTFGCGQNCIDFYDYSTHLPTSWQWYFPNASPDTSTAKNPINICYYTLGSYDVQLIACNSAGCDTLLLPGFINILPTPSAPVITVSNDTLFASGPYSFAWYEVSNPSVVLGTDSFFVFTPPGSYYVIARDSNGCDVVSNVVNTGVQSLTSEPFTITPNPASDELTISYPHHDKATIHIMNTLGETLLVSEIKTQNTKLDISSLGNGIYFLQFNTPSQRFNRKFVVQR